MTMLPALRFIQVPPERWTFSYYTAKMEHLFRVMTREQEHDGVSFDAPPITPRQAGAVITLFAEFLDDHNAHLAVTRGNDFLSPAQDYIWCSKHCDAIYTDDIEEFVSEYLKCGKECYIFEDFMDKT